MLHVSVGTEIGQEVGTTGAGHFLQLTSETGAIICNLNLMIILTYNSLSQGPKTVKKLKPRVPGGKKKRADKKARKAVCTCLAHVSP